KVDGMTRGGCGEDNVRLTLRCKVTREHALRPGFARNFPRSRLIQIRADPSCAFSSARHCRPPLNQPLRAQLSPLAQRARLCPELATKNLNHVRDAIGRSRDVQCSNLVASARPTAPPICAPLSAEFAKEPSPQPALPRSCWRRSCSPRRD